MVRAWFTLGVFVALAGTAGAQPSISATLGPGVNRVGDAGVADARQDYTASAEVEQQFLATRMRVFYSLDAGDYSTAGDWRFLAHGAGATYRFDRGPSKQHRLFIGADAVLRRNGASWSAADFNGVGGFANLETHPTPAATLRTGYRVDLRRFPTLPAMNQLQQSIFGSVLVNFESKTTLIAQVSGGTKHYSGVSNMTEVFAAPFDSPRTQEARGYGRGAGMGGTTLTPVVVTGAPGSNARQITVLARLAQSLAARAGLSMEVSRRNVGGSIPPALVATPAQFVDDGIYDDLFASDASRGSVTLTSIFGAGIQLVASAAWLDKRYPSTVAFDTDGTALPGVLRHDRVAMAGVEASWPLFASRTGPVALDLLGSYDYMRSRSTSALYRYSAHAVRLAVGITY